MKQTTKRILSLVLCFMMVMGLVPSLSLNASATEGEHYELFAADDVADAGVIGEETIPAETTVPDAAETEPSDITDEGAADVTVEEDLSVSDSEFEPEDSEIAPLADYDLGDTTVTVEEPVTAKGEGEITTTTKKIIYQLVSSLTAGEEYLIVNSNSAGDKKALAASTTGVDVTVKNSDATSTVCYIEDKGNALEWTASDSWTFSSGNYDLGYDSGLAFDESDTWSYSNNRLSTRVSSMFGIGSSTYYLQYSSGWTTTSSSSSSGTSIYFYQKNEVEVETTSTVSGTYSIAGDPAEVKVVVEEGSTADLGSTLTFTPDSGTATTEDVSAEAAYEICSDPDSIIDDIAGNTVTFSGIYGKALVKVSYEVADAIVTNYITVEATTPFYTIDITHQPEGEAEYVPVTSTIVVKGVKADDTYELWADLYLNGVTDVTIDDTSKMTWDSDDKTVATVDNQGNVTFTGKEGQVEITVYYAFANANGETVYATDVVTFSVSASNYIVPEDGTEDFPEYPNEGAVRIDKNATAVGNFSQTGMAKVELSMTGVPYSKGREVDVVIMVDMSGSMTASNNDQRVDRVTPAKNATRAALEALVKNEDGTFNENRVAVYTFGAQPNSGPGMINPNNNGYRDLGTFDEASLTEMIGTKNSNGVYTGGTIGNWSAKNGTGYDAALEKCYEVLAAAKTDGIGNNRRQFVIFVTDGAPSTNFYYVKSDGTKGDLGDVGSGSEDDISRYDLDSYTEWYSYQMKKAGVDVYSVAVQLASSATTSIGVLKGIAGTKNEQGQVVNAKNSEYSKYYKSVGTNIDDLTDMFLSIVGEIKQAATNVRVEDKVDPHYSVSFKLPNSGVTADEAGMSEFYIQAVRYTLNEDKERVGDPAVIENFTFNADGTLKSHTVDGSTCENCAHVAMNGGAVTGIDGTYFDYSIDASGDEFLNWTAEKLDTTELALQYFVYLDESAGLDVEDQVDAGTYSTNEYAHVTYTNYLGNECRKYFPVPSMTWNGAQVTYVFYLVNSNGQPVNRAGRVIPFAEAIYVTEPVKENVVWYGDNSKTELSAEYLAADIVPDVYALYDSNAYYEIDVYQTEGVDQGNGKNYNHFIIEGSSDVTNKNTTKVFNTKSGPRYDAYGAYSNTAGTYTSAKSGTSYTATVTDNIDYANTTVAFAVVWEPELKSDTVVVDYGLDVVIDVSANDGLAAGVTGVMLSAPNALENTGSYITSVGANSVTSADGIWTASVENLSSVRFQMNEMGINDAVKFYYEAGVDYYNNGTLVSTNMYSSVTVVPATSIYYEDDFVTYESYTWENGWVKNTEESLWTEVSEGASSATQAQDRPGDENYGIIGSGLDANNIYGYDGAYSEMNLYSNGSAMKATVNYDNYAQASFDFWGTGFDVISLTSNTTGTILVDVVNMGTNETVGSFMVDTYYGYDLVEYYEYTYIWHEHPNGNKQWDRYVTDVISIEDWTAAPKADESRPVDPKHGDSYKIYRPAFHVDTESSNALYQIPVMKVEDLAYGHYMVTIKATYDPMFVHNTGSASYDFYLDAIRIYDPANNGVGKNDAVLDAYEKDHEAYPHYFELRNAILSANDFENQDPNNEVAGIVYIDSADANGSIDDYLKYGPNNELYLSAGQAVSFKFDTAAIQAAVAAEDTSSALAGYEIDKIHIGLKLATGSTSTVKMYDAAKTQAVNVGGMELTTATDMYYDITDLAGSEALVINNAAGNGILSITDIKVTYKKTESGTQTTSVADSIFLVSHDIARMALDSLDPNAAPGQPELPETPVEPEVFAPSVLSVKVNKTSVKEGQKVKITVNTSCDVKYITVNGRIITDYKSNHGSVIRSWVVELVAEGDAQMQIDVVAYNSDDVASEAASTTVQIQKGKWAFDLIR